MIVQAFTSIAWLYALREEMPPFQDQCPRHHHGVTHRLSWIAVAKRSLPAVCKLHQVVVQLIFFASDGGERLLLVPAQIGKRIHGQLVAQCIYESHR